MDIVDFILSSLNNNDAVFIGDNVIITLEVDYTACFTCQIEVNNHSYFRETNCLQTSSSIQPVARNHKKITKPSTFL